MTPPPLPTVGPPRPGRLPAGDTTPPPRRQGELRGANERGRVRGGRAPVLRVDLGEGQPLFSVPAPTSSPAPDDGLKSSVFSPSPWDTPTVITSLPSNS